MLFDTKFKNNIKYIMKENKSTLIVGISGGADSTALLSALCNLRLEYNLTIIAAHINYQMRANDSENDELYVKKICNFLRVKLEIKKVKMKLSESGIEQKARDIRFDFFYKLMDKYKADKIALGHNKNDQVETVLFKLCRGTGLTGLKGIELDSGSVVHPLINFYRYEIEEYLSSKKIDWRIDKTNMSNNYSRNKIRNIIVPNLEKYVNKKTCNHICDTASLVAEANFFIEKYTRKVFDNVIKEVNENSLIFDLIKIKKEDSIIQNYLFRLALEKLTLNVNDVYKNHIDLIRKLMNVNGSASIILSKQITVLKEYDKISFVKGKSKKNKIEKIIINKIIPKIEFEDFYLVFEETNDTVSSSNNKYSVVVDKKNIKLPIVIKTREPGDKFIPVGMSGRKKVKDFFIDEKVSKFDRDRILLMVDKEKILWIIGYRLDSRVVANNKTKDKMKISIIFKREINE